MKTYIELKSEMDRLEAQMEEAKKTGTRQSAQKGQAAV
jgi:hypothetical protein